MEQKEIRTDRLLYLAFKKLGRLWNFNVNFSHSIDSGYDFSFLSGPNGIGKTTILRIIEVLCNSIRNGSDPKKRFFEEIKTPFEEAFFLFAPKDGLEASYTAIRIVASSESMPFFTTLKATKEIELTSVENVALSRDFYFLQFSSEKAGIKAIEDAYAGSSDKWQELTPQFPNSSLPIYYFLSANKLLSEKKKNPFDDFNQTINAIESQEPSNNYGMTLVCTEINPYIYIAWFFQEAINANHEYFDTLLKHLDQTGNNDKKDCSKLVASVKPIITAMLSKLGQKLSGYNSDPDIDFVSPTFFIKDTDDDGKPIKSPLHKISLTSWAKMKSILSSEHGQEGEMVLSFFAEMCLLSGGDFVGPFFTTGDGVSDVYNDQENDGKTLLKEFLGKINVDKNRMIPKDLYKNFYNVFKTAYSDQNRSSRLMVHGLSALRFNDVIEALTGGRIVRMLLNAEHAFDNATTDMGYHLAFYYRDPLYNGPSSKERFVSFVWKRSYPDKDLIPFRTSTSLSNGEQCLILMIYTLLFTSDRENDHYVFLFDEPENSLHVYWQNSLVEAIRPLLSNCESQLLLATHAPLIFGPYSDAVAPLTFMEVIEKDGRNIN